MTTAAQDEFDELFRDKDRSTKHPEDRANHSSSDDDDHSDKDQPAETYYERDSEDEDDLTSSSNMRSKYFLPNIVSDANTGPKGVIADAQAFEQAKKKRRFSLRKVKEHSEYATNTTNDEEEEEGSFLQRWRQNRLKELQEKRTLVSHNRSRTTSPSSRLYGSMTTVDADGYLDAIEKVSPRTTVAVLIYDDASEISAMVEDCFDELARLHPTTRFVKLHYEEAEMEIAGVPALLAYRGGEKFAGLVPLLNEVPDDAEPTATTFESVLKRHQILF